MLSINPFDLSQPNNEDTEKQILRIALISELDSVNLFEQLAFVSKDTKAKAVFHNILKEKKEHIGELETFLLRSDQEQMEGLAEGTKELEKLDEAN
ncbi:MAG: rubrerythrin [Candidatus Pacebacteria bacterium]|jgi:rubrerythrin|nr:rubrerythrin [Candidatus Paceibacterota bacterium]